MDVFRDPYANLTGSPLPGNPGSASPLRLGDSLNGVMFLFSFNSLFWCSIYHR